MKTLTQQEINENEWKDFWESISKTIKNKIQDCTILLETYSVGIAHNGMFFQLRGSDKTFKFKNNEKVFIKSTSSKTGRFIKVFEYDIKKQTATTSKQAHHILNKNNEDEVKFLESLKDCVVSHFKPNSIKFILGDL